MTAEEKKVIDAIEKQMNDAGYETAHVDAEGLEVLRVLLDGLGENEDGEALMELCYIPLSDDTVELPEDLRAFQVYTTLATDIPEENFSRVLLNLNKENMECLLGGYYIFEPERQMYHKSISVVRGNTAEEMLTIIQPAVNWIGATVIESYDELVALCS